MMDKIDVVTNQEQEVAQPAKVNVGMTLREARERMGMSVNDVAERIKFAPKQVEALESNDFAHLPQATFLRGFVRSYARVLQLDEAALIAALPVEPTKQVAVKASGMNVPFRTVQSLSSINLAWLAGALSVALLLGLFVWWSGKAPKSQLDNLVVEPVPLPTVESDAASSVVMAEVPSTEPDRMSESSSMTNEPEAMAESVNDRPADVAVEPQVASAPAAEAKPQVTLEMLKRRPLHFVFSEDTWAEVIDVNGNVLLSRNNPRGSEKWIGGPRRAPYDISIAHPVNVKLYYKGEEIDLSPYAAMEVAHFKVE